MSHIESAAMSVPEFAKWAGISRGHVYAQARAGKIRVRKVGARSIISADDAKAWLDALPVSGSN